MLMIDMMMLMIDDVCFFFVHMMIFFAFLEKCMYVCSLYMFIYAKVTFLEKFYVCMFSVYVHMCIFRNFCVCMFIYAKVTFKKKRKCMYVHMQRICKS
jgi:hypothetical protein